MGSRWIPRIGAPGAFGGSAPLPGGDHFAPRYLVGNVLAGDPAVAQVSPFRYIPDPGDGTGIALALAEAAVTAGDVWIRPGNYTLAIATPIPLVIPAGITVRGSGINTTRIISDGLRRNVCSLADGASLRDLTIEVPTPVGNPLGAQVVSLLAGTQLMRDVTILVTTGPNETLTAFIRGTGTLLASQIEHCICILAAGPTDEVGIVAVALDNNLAYDSVVVSGLWAIGAISAFLVVAGADCRFEGRGDLSRVGEIRGSRHEVAWQGGCHGFGIPISPEALLLTSATRCKAEVQLLADGVSAGAAGIRIDGASAKTKIVGSSTIGFDVGLSVDAGNGNTTIGSSYDGNVTGLNIAAAAVNTMAVTNILTAPAPLADAGVGSETSHNILV